MQSVVLQKWVALPVGSSSCLVWHWDDVKIAYAWFQECQPWLLHELRFSSQELCAEFITWWPLFWLDAALAVHCLLRVAAIRSYSVSPAELSSLPRSASLRLIRPKSRAIYPFCLPLFPPCCSSVLQAVPTGMHREKSILVLPHFHKMVLLLAVITDVFFPVTLLFKCHLRLTQFYHFIT